MANLDMILLAQVLDLYDRPSGSLAAILVANDDDANAEPLTAEELGAILDYSGVDYMLANGDPDLVVTFACEHADKGCATLIRLRVEGMEPALQWHLLGNQVDGNRETLRPCETTRAPSYFGHLRFFLDGPALILDMPCPNYKGNWATLIAERYHPQ